MADSKLKTFTEALTALSLIESIISATVFFSANAYFSITCNTDSILNTEVNSKDRWAAAKADLALKAAERNWNQVADSQGTDIQLGFVNSMLNLWGQGDTVNCGLVDGSCDCSALQCGDSTKPGGVPHPGSWMIMKSTFSSSRSLCLKPGRQKLEPIIFMENAQCDTGNPLGLMNNDPTHSDGSCAVNSKTFFLIEFNNQQCQYGSHGNYGGGNHACETDVFQKLQGTDQLSDYGFDKNNIIRKYACPRPSNCLFLLSFFPFLFLPSLV